MSDNVHRDWDQNYRGRFGHQPRLYPNSGGGNDGSDIKERVAVLEQIAKETKEILARMEKRLDRIEDRHDREFKLIFGAIITVALGLTGVMAKGFHWL